ncbi:MAG TPA: hypothetical protein VJL88_08280 [Nitrospira sp.]|nr:hypothetical protein [Nitrospira sp.]
MKRMLMAIMAVAVAISFSAPAFADDQKKGEEKKKGGGHVVINADDMGKKKDEKDKGKK